jgi:sec-independent protein translocase protein TatC
MVATVFGILPGVIVNTPRLHLLTPTESMMAYFKTALVAGIFLSFPVIMAQVWLFVSPGLYRRERRAVLPFLICGWIMFLTGGAFGYFIMLRYALLFLAGFGSTTYEVTWSLARYLNFALLTLLVCGTIFELPVVCTLLTKLGVISPHAMTRNWRPAIVIMALMAAILTPQDPFTMVLMFGPLLVLYGVSIVASRMVYRPVLDPEDDDSVSQPES